MEFKQALNEYVSATTMNNIVGTDNPSFVDWASGNGPETDLGKRQKKKRKKDKIVRRRMPKSIKV